MIWIGWTLVRSAITVGNTVERMDKGALWKTFRRAVATCLLNPKAYLFVIAVYPQFLKPVYGPIWLQGLALGLMTLITQALVYGGVALAADRARATLTGNPTATIWVGRAAGELLIAAAALYAVAGPGRRLRHRAAR